ncbi:MAG: DUF962 domain-containing protein [Bacteroidia bacterium]|nr:DUF962 domain-containing protein [Bacteroidia bacterium]
MKKQYKSLQEFYPFYISQHQNKTSRILHFIGTSLFIFTFFGSFIFHQVSILLISPILAYVFAWIGHFFFEKNKPATFQYPLYSLASDFILYFEILTGKESFDAKQDKL